MLPCIKLQTVVSGLPTPPMVRLDINSLQTLADVNGISGESENVCVCTSLPSSGGHQSRRPPPQSRHAA